MRLAVLLQTLRQGVDDLLVQLEAMQPADKSTLAHPARLVTQVHTFVVFKANQLAHLMAAQATSASTLPSSCSLVCCECFRQMTGAPELDGSHWQVHEFGVNIYTCSRECMNALCARYRRETSGPVCQRKGCDKPAEVGDYCQSCYSITQC
jgi:hypothetical protein